jgi:hypothetical protein
MTSNARVMITREYLEAEYSDKVISLELCHAQLGNAKRH